MDLSRRSFFGGILSVAGAAMLPAPLFAAAPVIYADGFRDDTAGLQAALRGEPFRVMREGLAVNRGGVLYLAGGTFLLNDTIRPTARVPVLSTRNLFDFRNAPVGLECGFDITDAEGSRFVSDVMDGRGKVDCAILDRGFHYENRLSGCYIETQL